MLPSSRPSERSIQSIGLKIESSIHSQAIAASATGVVHGSSTRNRTSHLNAEVADEDQRQRLAEHDDEHHRDGGEDERVPQRAPEDRVVQDRREVLAADPVVARVAGGHVAEGERDRQQERDRDEHEDVGDRRQQEQPGERASPGRPRRAAARRAGSRFAAVSPLVGVEARRQVAAPCSANSCTVSGLDRRRHRRRRAWRSRASARRARAPSRRCSGRRTGTRRGRRRTSRSAAGRRRRRARPAGALGPEADELAVARDEVHRRRAEERRDERVRRVAGRPRAAGRAGAACRRTSPRCGRRGPSPRSGRA